MENKKHNSHLKIPIPLQWCCARIFSDSGYNCESLKEDATVKVEAGVKVSAKEGSPQTQEKKKSLNHQCFGRGANEKKPKEEDRSLDLEEKPLPPPQVLSWTPADRAGNRDLLVKIILVYTIRILSKIL